MLDHQTSEVFGQCIRDDNGVIHFQNAISQRTCGDQLGKVCEACDAKARESDQKDQGIYPHKNIQIGESHCDVVTLNNGPLRTTFFYPLEDDIASIKEKLGNAGFTEQEARIVDRLLHGATNQEICTALSMGVATLKTHINHIYRKAPSLRTLRKQLKAY